MEPEYHHAYRPALGEGQDFPEIKVEGEYRPSFSGLAKTSLSTICVILIRIQDESIVD